MSTPEHPNIWTTPKKPNRLNERKPGHRPWHFCNWPSHPSPAIRRTPTPLASAAASTRSMWISNLHRSPGGSCRSRHWNPGNPTASTSTRSPSGNCSKPSAWPTEPDNQPDSAPCHTRRPRGPTPGSRLAVGSNPDAISRKHRCQRFRIPESPSEFGPMCLSSLNGRLMNFPSRMRTRMKES